MVYCHCLVTSHYIYIYIYNLCKLVNYYFDWSRFSPSIHLKIIKEISNIEDTLHELEKAIQDKDGALRLAETRLGIRKERPNVELCRDPANYR